MQTKTYSQRPGSLTRRPSSRPSSVTSQQKKPWQQSHRRPSFRSGHSKSRVHPDSEEEERLSRQALRQSAPKWWKIRLFHGMVEDIKRRAPLYLSDWTDAWDYRVVPATVYMYFAKYEDGTPPLSTLCIVTRSLRFDGDAAQPNILFVRPGHLPRSFSQPFI